MIEQTTCYIATCDNCGEIFSDWHDFSIFPTEADVKDRMNNDSEWYTGRSDMDHKDKHYCPACYKQDTEDEDKIIVDLSRNKQSDHQSLNIEK